MKIEANVRVVKSSAATEVFVTRDRDPYINFALHLPADAEIKSGDSIELVGPPDTAPAVETAPKATRLSTANPPPQV